MFKEPLSSLGTPSLLELSDIKELRETVVALFPGSSKHADILVPEGILSQKFTTGKTPGLLFMDSRSSNNPLWFSLGEGSNLDSLVPTVYTLQKLPTLLPFLSASKEIITPILSGGADLMIHQVTHCSSPILVKDQLVSIRKLEHSNDSTPMISTPLAVGQMAFTIVHPFDGGYQGKAVSLLHFWQDYLWELGSKGEVPPSVPPKLRLFDFLPRSPPTSNSHVTHPSLLSEEARHYYNGLPSAPVLVARTSITPWEKPTGPEAFKELRPIGDHPLQKVWENKVASEVHKYLKSRRVEWTSTDVVRIGNAKQSFVPILWIGVKPGSLSRNEGFNVASQCKQFLVKHNIGDVDVEIRESDIIRSTGPKLLPLTSSAGHLVDVCEPLTTALSLPICASSTHTYEGNGGFFIAEGGNTKRLLLVTARHVVFPPEKNDNKLFVYKNGSRHHKVALFGPKAFEDYLKSIEAEIKRKDIIAAYHAGEMNALRGNNSAAADRKRHREQANFDEVERAKRELQIFYSKTQASWKPLANRALGHVILSPPIKFGAGEGYTEDWAVIEIDTSKIDRDNFDGNVIDLGTRIARDEFNRRMHPNPTNPHSFTYPADRLLRLGGTILNEEMRRPTALDQNGDPCLMVIKRGNATGLTVGRANNIFSYIRTPSNDGKGEISKEWSIFSFDESGAFSAKGDSGSVIVDGRGRIGGLLTGGSGITHSLDITYATPIEFLLQRMIDNRMYRPNVNMDLSSQADQTGGSGRAQRA
ncbi:hypothetical protein GYMLUDRAFT_381919 [Collybiopsis luxurians FD-317 M1]|nr:hypothetical protein GYMLUDRAFT_381919 [Collybiopsis luxurians FD-317 M1]